MSFAGVASPGIGGPPLGAHWVQPIVRSAGARQAEPLRRLEAWTPRMTVADRADDGSDAALVERARAGDTQSFAQLVDRYQQRVFWVARGMLGNDEDARDAAQEAFIRVYRSLDRFDVRLKFYTWLYQIVVNLCIDMLRKQVKRRGVSLEQVGDVAGQGNGAGTLEATELRQRVYRVLDELPPKYRTVMVLSDLEGIGAKDIAHMTGTTHATVRWRHHRARQLFREAWERIHGKGSHVV
ncbi:MAG: sigma-70 family RNA polymerase sigma factor [Planctomycetota bacterium]|nr:sigma-70 family RNA polymerase sigma factor [Planctomycetota bacterium]